MNWHGWVWDGGRWHLLPKKGMPEIEASTPSFASTGKGGVWLGGGWGATTQPGIARWAGRAWQPYQASPVSGAEQYVSFNGLATVDPDNVWGVGQALPPGQGDIFSYVERWNGKRWQLAASGLPGSLYAITTAGGRVWAVGDQNCQPLVMTGSATN